MSLLKEVTEEKVRNSTSHSLQDEKGDWYIKDDLQKKEFKTYAEAHILKNKLSPDPRVGLNRVFMWDKKTSTWDEKIIRDYNKFAQGKKSSIQFNSKKLDLIKKATRLMRERPQETVIRSYADQVGDSAEMVDEYLEDRKKGYLEFSKQNKQLNIKAKKIGADKIERGHEISLTTDVGETEQGFKKLPPTSQYTQFQEPKFENRGSGQVGGSSKTINLNAAAGTVPRTWSEDYEFWKTERQSRLTGEVNPLAPIKEEFHPEEQKILRDLPEKASKTVVNNAIDKIYKNREKLQKQHGIELFGGKAGKLDAEGLFRNIAKAAGQSNNPLANVSGDIVGAVMDGVAFAANPKDKDALADLALSGSQALLSLSSIGLAALPIPGARPGAFMLMKLGDNIGKVERIWNLTGKFNSTNKVKQAQNIINQKATENALTGSINTTRPKF